MKRWTHLETGPFRFGPAAPDPLEVEVRHRILEPGPAGPIQTGEIIHRYRDGKLVSEAHRGEVGP